jgi:hypothetical protein
VGLSRACARSVDLVELVELRLEPVHPRPWPLLSAAGEQRRGSAVAAVRCRRRIPAGVSSKRREEIPCAAARAGRLVTTRVRTAAPPHRRTLPGAPDTVKWR